MAAPTGEKWILLRGFRYVDPPEGTSSRHVERKKTELWFIIKRTANGSQIEEVYKDLPTDQKEEFPFLQSACALIGSSLYVFGGRGDTFLTRDRVSDHVRCLNTRNPTEGWKTYGRLPFPCAYSTVGVAGNFIYIFPLFGGDRETQVGCIYDTIKQKGWAIQVAPDCSDCQLSPPASSCRSLSIFCAAFDDGPENRGVMVSKHWRHVYIYNPDQNSWKNVCNFLLPVDHRATFAPLHAALNGILYLSCCDGYKRDPTIFLSLYDIGTGEALVYDLPLKFKNLDLETDSRLFVVAIADYKLCYLWYRGIYLSNRRTLYLAKVELYFDTLSGTFTATNSEEKLDLNAHALFDCLPFDSDLYQKPKGECRQHDSYLDQGKEDEAGDVHTTLGLGAFICRMKPKHRRQKKSIWRP